MILNLNLFIGHSLESKVHSFKNVYITMMKTQTREVKTNERNDITMKRLMTITTRTKDNSNNNKCRSSINNNNTLKK